AGCAMEGLTHRGMARTNTCGHEHLHGLANQFVTRVTEQFFALGIRQPDDPGFAHHHQASRRELKYATEKPLRLPRPLFGAPALRDVAEADDGSHQLAAFPDWRGTILNRQPLAVLTPQKLVFNAALFALRLGSKNGTLLKRVVAAIGAVVMEEPVRLLINHLHHRKAQ